jgi:hypothetical protein
MQAARTSTTLLTHHETRTARRHQGMRRACSFAMKACNSAMYSSIARYSRMAGRSCTRRSSLKSTASCARYSLCDKASISSSVCGILWTLVAIVWACSCNVVCVWISWRCGEYPYCWTLCNTMDITNCGGPCASPQQRPSGRVPLAEVRRGCTEWQKYLDDASNSAASKQDLASCVKHQNQLQSHALPDSSEQRSRRRASHRNLRYKDAENEADGQRPSPSFRLYISSFDRGRSVGVARYPFCMTCCLFRPPAYCTSIRQSCLISTQDAQEHGEDAT